MEFQQCEHTYAHHAHQWLRGNERSISDAPLCPGVASDEAETETDEVS